MKYYFGAHLKLLAGQLKKSEAETAQQLQTWYNGYRFSDDDLKVYNPYSVLNLFKSGRFKNWCKPKF